MQRRMKRSAVHIGIRTILVSVVILLGSVVFGGVLRLVEAQENLSSADLKKTQVFQYYKTVSTDRLEVPTVIEVPVFRFLRGKEAVVYDMEEEKFLPALVVKNNLVNTNSNVRVGIRFLTQPEREYRVYYGNDRASDISTGERPNLRDNEGVEVISGGSRSNNANYTPPDRDEDGVPDRDDNCPSIANSQQVDKNENGKGDACEDFDRDGSLNANDNCKNAPNRSQSDKDNDGIGDACDEQDNRLIEGNPWITWVALIVVGGAMLGFIGFAVRKFGLK